MIYQSDSYYNSLTEHEGKHKEGFNIQIDIESGGWLITGNIKAFKKWLKDEGIV